ncbi:RNA polymerase sigma factor [Aestuariivirga litoralis]|uniref:RNA polymerase sigma factor n=1 Tax=Aestuariivirga litoralis TaxID=2650924 RepID=UPI0018C51312|nr:sigma-70 family RNA polymerase sigma factor [Aestuariivirga litoralis]
MRQVATNRDRTAYEQLFDVIAPRLQGQLSRLGLQRTEAEDIIQDVMVNVWVKAGMYLPEKGSVFAWVFVMARNLRIDRARKLRPQVLMDFSEYDEPDTAENPEEQTLRYSHLSALKIAMDSLSAEQREIYDLIFREELTQHEIAARLNLPLGTVKSRMRLAQVHLRKSMEKSS